MMRQPSSVDECTEGNYDADGNAMVITDRPGMAVWQLHAHGVEAHAGNGHATGVNSIAAAARCLLDLQELTDYNRSLTVNAGTVSGGTTHNTVPLTLSQATAQLDLCVVNFMHHSAQRKIYDKHIY